MPWSSHWGSSARVRKSLGGTEKEGLKSLGFFLGSPTRTLVLDCLYFLLDLPILLAPPLSLSQPLPPTRGLGFLRLLLGHKMSRYFNTASATSFLGLLLCDYDGPLHLLILILKKSRRQKKLSKLHNTFFFLLIFILKQNRKNISHISWF